MQLNDISTVTPDLSQLAGDWRQKWVWCKASKHFLNRVQHWNMWWKAAAQVAPHLSSPTAGCVGPSVKGGSAFDALVSCTVQPEHLPCVSHLFFKLPVSQVPAGILWQHGKKVGSRDKAMQSIWELDVCHVQTRFSQIWDGRAGGWYSGSDEKEGLWPGWGSRKGRQGTFRGCNNNDLSYRKDWHSYRLYLVWLQVNSFFSREVTILPFIVASCLSKLVQAFQSIE